VWTGRSSIELAELERAQEESNPHFQVRNLVPWSFRRWALEYPQREPNVPVQVVVLVFGRRSMRAAMAAMTGLEPAPSTLTGWRTTVVLHHQRSGAGTRTPTCRD
jgi:hypothetical protein